MSAHSSGLLPPDELVDLHIFVVPLDLWLEKYRTAFNNSALESVSAGFVRVQPYVSLNYLRDHVEEQLGPEIVPEDYVFLRSVGRCMAVVKENQERLLKAKDFLPPVAYSPEIFVLPGTHDSVARPVENASNTIIQTHGFTTAGMASIQPHQLPPAGYMQHPQAMPNMLPGGYLPQQSAGQVEQMAYQQRDDPFVNRTKRTTRSTKSTSDDEGSSDYERPQGEGNQEVDDRRQSLEDRSGGSSENDGGDRPALMEKTEQRRKQKKDNPDEQDEAPAVVPSKSKKHRMQKKGSSSSSGSNQSETKTVKFIQPEVYQSLPVPGQGGVLVSPPTPIPSGRVISSPMPVQRADPVTDPSGKEDSFDKNNRNTRAKVDEKGAVAADKKKKPADAKGGKKKRRERSRSPSVERVQTKEQGSQKENSADIIYENHDNSAVYGEVTMSRVESPPSLSEVEERSKFVQFPSPAKGARRPPLSDGLEYGNAFGNGSNDMDNSFGGEDYLNNNYALENQGFGTAENDSANNNVGVNNLGLDEEKNALNDPLQGVEGDVQNAGAAGKDGNKMGAKDGAKKDGAKGNAAKGKKTVKKPVKKPAENLDEKFKIPQIPKVPTPPPMKYPQRGTKEFGEDTASAKDRKHREIEELKAELRKAKNARVDTEKERESKVRRAKMLQNQMLQKRNQSKNIWKKRFFEEKRKTAALEEQVNRLRHEVDAQHKALMSYLENKEREGNKTGQAVGDFKSPSEKTNQRMSLARLQHEVEELRRRIEELKVKLTAEMKNRDVAQKELKQIRQDLMEKKINLTLTKSQKSLATLTNPENIAV